MGGRITATLPAARCADLYLGVLHDRLETVISRSRNLLIDRFFRRCYVPRRNAPSHPRFAASSKSAPFLAFSFVVCRGPLRNIVRGYRLGSCLEGKAK